MVLFSRPGKCDLFSAVSISCVSFYDFIFMKYEKKLVCAIKWITLRLVFVFNFYHAIQKYIKKSLKFHFTIFFAYLFLNRKVLFGLSSPKYYKRKHERLLYIFVRLRHAMIPFSRTDSSRQQLITLGS